MAAAAAAAVAMVSHLHPLQVPAPAVVDWSRRMTSPGSLATALVVVQVVMAVVAAAAMAVGVATDSAAAAAAAEVVARVVRVMGVSKVAVGEAAQGVAVATRIPAGHLGTTEDTKQRGGRSLLEC